MSKVITVGIGLGLLAYGAVLTWYEIDVNWPHEADKRMRYAKVLVTDPNEHNLLRHNYMMAAKNEFLAHVIIYVAFWVVYGVSAWKCQVFFKPQAQVEHAHIDDDANRHQRQPIHPDPPASNAQQSGTHTQLPPLSSSIALRQGNPDHHIAHTMGDIAPTFHISGT